MLNTSPLCRRIYFLKLFVLLRVSGDALRHHLRHLLRIMGEVCVTLRRDTSDALSTKEELVLLQLRTTVEVDDAVDSTTTVRRLLVGGLPLALCAATGRVTQRCSSAEVLSMTELEALAPQGASTGVEGGLVDSGLAAACCFAVCLGSPQALLEANSGATQR